MRRRSIRQQQKLQRQKRKERLQQLKRDAAHLRELAERLATRKRRSLRLQWLSDEAEYIATGKGPSSIPVLYGEERYTETDPTAPGTYPREGFGRIFREVPGWYDSDSDSTILEFLKGTTRKKHK